MGKPEEARESTQSTVTGKHAYRMQQRKTPRIQSTKAEDTAEGMPADARLLFMRSASVSATARVNPW
jgi:hypothetical protein